MTATNSKKRKLDDSSSSPADASSLLFPPPFTTKTLEQRLRKGIMVQSGGQKGSLTRCVQKYALLLLTTTGAAKDSDEKNNELLLQQQQKEFQQELEWYRMDLTKSVLLQRNLAREIQDNQVIEQALDEQMEELKAQVHECQQQAKRAKQVQSCFQEYEALSKLANTCLEQTDNNGGGDSSNTTTANATTANNASSKTTSTESSTIHSTQQLKEEIARVKQEIASNRTEETKLDSILAVRKNQFHLLIQCMLDLKRSLDDNDNDNEDDEEEEGDDAEEKDQKVISDKGEEAPTAMQVDDEDGAIDDDDDDNLYGDLL